jgi:O-antigen/teichoic acid export membrane protein
LLKALGNLGLLLFLVRLLRPEDFAILALSNFTVNFFLLLLTGAFTNAIIQLPTPNLVQRSTLYWSELIVGAISFLIVSQTSLLIAAFYGEEALSEVLAFHASILLITPIGNHFRALMLKNLIYETVGKIESIGTFVYLILTTCLAYKGYGLYAVIWGAIGRTVLEAVLYLFLGRKNYLPGFFFDISSIPAYLNFGCLQIFERLTIYVLYQWDVILIGKLLGMEALGLYEVFKRLLSKMTGLLASIVDRVTFPLFSKYQKDITWVRKTYLKTLLIYNSLSFPIIFGMLILAPPILSLFLGNDWTGDLITFQLVALLMAINGISNPLDNVLIAIGKIKIWLNYNVVLLILCPFFILIGRGFGLNGILIALIGFSIINLSTAYYYLLKPYLTLPLYLYLQAIVFPIFLAATTMLPVYLLRFIFEESAYYLIAGGLTSVFSFFIVNYLFNRPLYEDVKMLLNRKYENINHNDRLLS